MLNEIPVFGVELTVTPFFFSLYLRFFIFRASLNIGRDAPMLVRNIPNISWELYIAFRPDWKHINWVANAYGFDFMVWDGVSHGLRRLK